jgi:hypothetical protein
MQDDERSLLVGRLVQERDLRFVETLLNIRATIAGAMMAAGQDPGQSLSDLLKDYRNLLYPEDRTDLQETARRHEEMLKAEFAKGPLKVQAQEYSKKRKKSPR